MKVKKVSMKKALDETNESNGPPEIINNESPIPIPEPINKKSYDSCSSIDIGNHENDAQKNITVSENLPISIVEENSENNHVPKVEDKNNVMGEDTNNIPHLPKPDDDSVLSIARDKTKDKSTTTFDPEITEINDLGSDIPDSDHSLIGRKDKNHALVTYEMHNSTNSATDVKENNLENIALSEEETQDDEAQRVIDPQKLPKPINDEHKSSTGTIEVPLQSEKKDDVRALYHQKHRRIIEIEKNKVTTSYKIKIEDEGNKTYDGPPKFTRSDLTTTSYDNSKSYQLLKKTKVVEKKKEIINYNETTNEEIKNDKPNEEVNDQIDKNVTEISKDNEDVNDNYDNVLSLQESGQSLENEKNQEIPTPEQDDEKNICEDLRSSQETKPPLENEASKPETDDHDKNIYEDLKSSHDSPTNPGPSKNDNDLLNLNDEKQIEGQTKPTSIEVDKNSSLAQTKIIESDEYTEHEQMICKGRAYCIDDTCKSRNDKGTMTTPELLKDFKVDKNYESSQGSCQNKEFVKDEENKVSAEKERENKVLAEKEEEKVLVEKEEEIKALPEKDEDNKESIEKDMPKSSIPPEQEKSEDKVNDLQGSQDNKNLLGNEENKSISINEDAQNNKIYENIPNDRDNINKEAEKIASTRDNWNEIQADLQEDFQEYKQTTEIHKTTKMTTNKEIKNEATGYYENVKIIEETEQKIEMEQNNLKSPLNSPRFKEVNSELKNSSPSNRNSLLESKPINQIDKSTMAPVEQLSAEDMDNINDTYQSMKEGIPSLETDKTITTSKLLKDSECGNKTYDGPPKFSKSEFCREKR